MLVDNQDMRFLVLQINTSHLLRNRGRGRARAAVSCQSAGGGRSGEGDKEGEVCVLIKPIFCAKGRQGKARERGGQVFIQSAVHISLGDVHLSSISIVCTRHRSYRKLYM